MKTEVWKWHFRFAWIPQHKIFYWEKQKLIITLLFVINKDNKKIPNLLRYLVSLNEHEIEGLIKMLLSEHCFFYHLVGHASLHVKHQFQHLIVGFAREKNLSRVNLKNSTCHRPEVNHGIISSANDYKKISTYKSVFSECLKD